MRAQIASRAAPRARACYGLVLLACAACQQTVLFELPGDGAAGASGADGGGFCPGGQPFFSQPKPESPMVIVVLDRSTNMDAPFGATATSQISAALNALDAVVSEYQAISFGYVEFPVATFGCSPTTSCCASQVTVPSQGSTSFDFAAHRCDTRSNMGCAMSAERPVGDALMNIGEAFTQGIAGQYILIITDGEPTCTGGTCQEAMQVSAFRLQGVKTAVVVLGNVTDGACLVQLAQTGGMESGGNTFYSATTLDDLTSTLKMIVGGQIAPGACTLDLRPPDNPDQVALSIAGSPITRGGPDGWAFVDNSHTQIKLSGASCQALLDSPAGSVGLVGCSSGRH